MNSSPRPSTAALLARVPAGRDLSIDFARALCLPIVVLLHALQMGIGGEPLRAFNSLAGFAPLSAATWVFMIMPVFFICGGFAAITQWRTLRDAGETPAHYIRVRSLRLAKPVVTVMLGVGAVLGIMSLCGADPDFLRTFAFRLAEPLWFIAVYIGCTALVPVMAWLHHRAAWPTYLGLALGAGLVDILTRGLGVPVGALNWLFVWLFAQQLGFGVRDGWFAKRPAWLLLALTAASYAGLAVLVWGVGYSPDMLTNLNPPTLCILLLALAQVYLFTLLQPRIRRLMTRGGALRFTGAVGMYGMTIYLWHTVAMAIIVAVQLACDIPFAPVLSAAWWATRPVWVALIVVVVVACCLTVPRLESGWPRPVERRTPLGLVILWSVCAIAGVGIVLTRGYLPWENGATGWLLVTVSAVMLTVGGPDTRPHKRKMGHRAAP